MNYWEESKAFVYEALDKAGKTTDKFVTIQKLKAKLYRLNRQLDELYIKLGKAEYESVKNSNNNVDLKTDFVADIDCILAEIDAVSLQLNDEKGTKICGNCGYRNNSDAVFCSGCGTEIK